MIYKNVSPCDHLKTLVKSFWMVDSEGDATIRREKIIPDGYPEMIFHYGDPYRANISGEWYTQEKYLIAGQITNYFFLENLGISGMIGIKFQPWAIKELFDLEMEPIVNQAISLPQCLFEKLNPFIQISNSSLRFEKKVKQIEEELTSMTSLSNRKNDRFQKAIKLLLETNGTKSLHDIRQEIHTSERSMERYFKKYVGLSPKLYSRIIRFSHIFHLIQSKDFNWTEISFLSGFYDQSHFIKNFKEFTGEDPSSYGFDEKNMANLFLKPN
jgi:AraC-like DNA-binding protein